VFFVDEIFRLFPGSGEWPFISLNIQAKFAVGNNSAAFAIDDLSVSSCRGASRCHRNEK
jgi:hypothetical protein